MGLNGLSLAPMNEATYEALLERHPPAHSDSSTLPMEVGQHRSFTVVGKEVLLAVRLFPSGSAGGPDGLRPQHLKDMLVDDFGRQSLLPALTSFYLAFLFWC